MKREKWNSRSAFIFAAIGSAAGLGNAIRFPYVAYANGGGAFLIPFFVALLTAGIPLLVLEFTLGQKYQAGSPTTMSKAKKRFEPFGWWTVICAFIIVSYYAGIMGWLWDYLLASFTLAWGAEPASYFINDVLQLSASPANLAGFSIPVLIGIVLTWICIYLILRKGTETLSKVIKYTVGLPIILLLILIIRSVSLPGAMTGLNYYLQPDFSRLLDYNVWIQAYAQVFFTLSLAMGIMIAYASYLPKDSDIVNNSLITILADAGISFGAGIAIFGTLGYMAQAQGVAVSEVAESGLGLAFIVYPEAINMLPGGAFVAGFFGVVFFLTLLTLGIDSAFSLVESTVAGVVDKWNLNKRKSTVWVIIILGLISLIYATKAGMYWVDIIDHYANNYGLIIGGILQAIAFGWFYKTESLRKFFNSVSEYQLGKWWNVMIKIIPLILIILLALNFYGDISELYEGYDYIYQWIGGWGILIAIAITSLILGNLKDKEINKTSDIKA